LSKDIESRYVKWQTVIEVVIEPDPRFNKKQKWVIATDFQMKDYQRIYLNIFL